MSVPHHYHFDHLAGLMFVRYLPCKIALFSLILIVYSLKGSHLHSSRNGRLHFLSFKMHSLQHLFGVLLNGMCFSPISFTNRFNLLFISGWTHRYSFILWVITPYYFTYLVHTVAALAIGSSLSWLLYLLIYFHYCDLFVSLFEDFLTHLCEKMF